MLIVVPLLNITESDNTQVLAVQLVQNMAVYSFNNSTLYTVSPKVIYLRPLQISNKILFRNIHLIQAGLQLTLDNVEANTPVLSIQINGNYLLNYQERIDELRKVEMAYYSSEYQNVQTSMIFDNLVKSQEEARFSMYTTLFITFLLVVSTHKILKIVFSNNSLFINLFNCLRYLFFILFPISCQVGTYFFSSDVNRLIIGPIERLVDLVRKISANPLGVEYKMLGEKEGFLEGMETTILLTTINKIGGLMQVGFGEAGATVIAKNLADSSGGRLNLMGGGTMIQSIFGFCDVR